MTRQEAIEIYLKKTRKAREVIGKLMKWNPSINQSDNAKNLGFTVTTCQHFSRKHGLKHSGHVGRPKGK